MKIGAFFSGEKGSVTVLVAIAMMALMGFVALVTDTGLVYLNQARITHALDSAVLAGVQELPGHPQEAVETAINYAQLNGLSGEEINIELAPDNKSITATADRRVDLVFARALGFQKADVAARARARVTPISAVVGAVPFGVLEDDYTFGEEVVLKEGGGEGTSGWFGALQLGGNGACVYRDNIKHGYSGEIKIGDIIPTESGNMSGPTGEGIDYRISQCHHVPRCSINSFVEGCPRILIVPIVNIESQNPGNHTFTVRVVGFGAFLVDAHIGSGNDNQVKGCFIRYVVPGETNEGGTDFGLYGSQLCE